MNYFILLTISILGSASLAANDHTANFCSDKNAKVCGHIGHMKGMKAKGESEFMVDILVADSVANFKVDLWMPEHGHGTTPVTVNPPKANKFQIKKALFTMAGKWIARVSFDIDKVNHKIEIPLAVSE